MLLLNMRSGETMRVPLGRVVLGRSKSCDLYLGHPTVSGEHAVIEHLGKNGWQIYDVGSRNGTKHNGVSLDPRVRYRLREGSTIAFGRCEDWWEVSYVGKRATSCELTPTLAGDPRRAMSACQIIVQVSCDEESARLVVKNGEESSEVGYRGHTYFLAYLARSRLADRERGASPDAEGWVHSSELAKEMRCEPADINLWVHRTRRALRQQGCAVAASIVERRGRTGFLRIGSSQVRVVRDADTLGTKPRSIQVNAVEAYPLAKSRPVQPAKTC